MSLKCYIKTENVQIFTKNCKLEWSIQIGKFSETSQRNKYKKLPFCYFLLLFSVYNFKFDILIYLKTY